MQPYLDRGYWLYTDNYYTCPALAYKLIERGTVSVGTVRHNRVRIPKCLANQSVAKGSSDYRVKAGLCVVKYIITTCHDPTSIVTVTTRTSTKDKPEAVQDYVLNMAGVDRNGPVDVLHATPSPHTKVVEKNFSCISSACAWCNWLVWTAMDQLVSYMPLRHRTQK